jgi:acetylornithine deacetylase/succinyl-diaminopimelate desuccinylase-like protein
LYVRQQLAEDDFEAVVVSIPSNNADFHDVINVWKHVRAVRERMLARHTWYRRIASRVAMRWATSRLLFFVVSMWTLGCSSRPPGAGNVSAVMVADAGAARPAAPAASAATTMTAEAKAPDAGTRAAADTSNAGGSIGSSAMSLDAGAAAKPKPPSAGEAATTSVDAGPALDPAIRSALDAVSPMRIGASIETLAAFTTRNTCSDATPSGNAIGAARDWIQAQLQAVPGFTVSLQDAPFRGCGGGSVTVQNVVAVKLGAHPERVFVIGGHYDSRAVDGTDPTDRSPGANDSGSQTAALIEIAHALSPLELDATIVVAAFTGEEQGLVGSSQLAQDYAKFVAPNATIEAMFNMDIVGGDNTVNNELTLQQFRLFSPGTPREFNARMGATDDTSPSRGVMRYVGHWGSLYVPSMTMLPNLREDRPSRGSDHTSFIDMGIPAVRFIETVESENAGTNASHQHSPNDLPMYVTPAYTARIVMLVVSVSASLARAPMAPQIERVSGAWMVSWSAPASGPAADHYVIAVRPTTENLYSTRVVVPAGATSRQLTAAELGLAAGAEFFVSVAAVDATGHESLFAYPEYRCDSAGCSVQAGSLDTTARN